MTPQENLRRALLNDEFPDDAPEDRLFSPTGTDALRQNRNIALSAWMTQVSGQDINAGSPTWQHDKDALAQGFFKIPTAKDITDEAIHDLVRSHIQTSDSATDLALESALSGRPLPQALGELNSLTGVSKTRGIRDRYMKEAASVYSGVAAKVAPYRGIINEAASVLSKEMDFTVPTTDAFQSVAEKLLQVPEQDRRLVIEAIGATGGATAEERSSYLNKIAATLGRYSETVGGRTESMLESLGSTVEQIANAPAEIASLLSGGGMGIQSQVAGAGERSKATQAELDRMRELQLLTDDIRKVSAQKIDPIKGNGWLENLGIGVASMVPQSAIAIANPALGYVANLAYFRDDIASNLKAQNPGMTTAQADNVAAITSPLNAAVETVTALIPWGKVNLPGVQKWMMAQTASVGAAARNLGIRALTGTAAEVGEEWLQAYLPNKAQELMQRMGMDMPGVDWEKNMPKFSEIAEETWGPALVFSLIGGGAASINDIKGGRALASDLDLLIARGTAPELAAKIKEASDAGDYRKVDSLFREEFVSDVKASKPDIQAATDRLKARFQTQEAVAVLQDVTSPEYTASVTRSPDGWQVRTGEGTIIPVDSAEAANQIYSKLRQVGSQQEADALVSVIDGYYEQGRQAETVFTGETVQAQEIKAGEGRVFAERRDERGVLISTREFNSQALETVRAEAEVAGIKTGTRGIFAHINGSNEVFPMRVADGAKEIVRRMNLYKSQAEGQPQVFTFLHENFESTWRLGIENGTFSDQETRTAMRALLPAFEGVTALNAEEAQFIDNLRTLANGQGNETMLRETVSEMVMRDVLGRDRQGRATGMKPGSISRAIEASVMGANTQEEASALKSILAAIKAFTAYLKGVFGTVDAITKARDEGKLGEEYDTFINKVLGIDEVKQMEGQAIDEAKAMLGVDEEAQAVIDAGNMAFSMSRAQPADTSNVTEMPDGAQLVGPTTFSITAYHGTPHKVDRFRMAKIGTGEGNQAFGWGLYFAKARKVAEQYRKGLTERDFIRKVREVFSEFDTSQDAIDALNELDLSDGQRKLVNVLKAEEWWGFDYPHQAVQAALREPENYDPSPEVLDALASFGNLYTVELLPDESDFLDWDKPLSEQSEKVKAILDGAGISEMIESRKSTDFPDIPLNVYSELAWDMGERKASERLASLGIPGIRFLDGSSRAAGEGTSNYVIFDESLVKILEENGQKVDAGNMAFSISPVTPEQDAEYLELAKNPEKNRTLLQKMVDAVANAAGYVIEAYHGTPYGEITIFDEKKSPDWYDGIGEDDRGENYSPGTTWLSSSKFIADGYSSGAYAQKAGPYKPTGIPVEDQDLPEGTTVRLLPGNGAKSILLTDDQVAADKIPESALTPAGRMKHRAQLQVHFPNGSSLGGASFVNRNGGKEPSSPQHALRLAREIYNLPIAQRETSRTYRVFLKLLNPAVLDMKGEKFARMGRKADAAKYNGHDGIVVQNVRDPGSSPTRAPIATTYGVFSPSQIKSADPVTYDDAGNVIPLSKRFNPETPNINFSISPIRNLNELSDQVERNFAENPAGALEVKSKVIRQFAELADKWSNERWTPQGNKIRPISEKRTVKSLDKEQAYRKRARQRELIDDGMNALTPETLMAWSQGVDALSKDPLVAKMLNDNGKLMSKSTAEDEGRNIKDQYDDAGWIPPQWYAKSGGIMPDVMANNLGFDTASEMWAALESSIKSHRNAKADYAKAEAAVKAVEKAAFEQARQEAQAWRDEADAMQKEDWSPRESLVRDIITLEAIVAMFPQEIRGKIGGFVTLARKASEAARLKVLQRQLERGQELLEKHLKEQYGTAVDKLLERYQSKRDSSGRISGKILSTATEQVDYAAEFIDLDIASQAKEQAALEKQVEESESAEEVQDALTKLGIARLFEVWSTKDSASRESAFLWLNETIEQGKQGKKLLDEERKAFLDDMRQSGQASILQGDELNAAVADNLTNFNKKVMRRALLGMRGVLSESLWTTLQRLELIFGEDSKILDYFAGKIINAANLSTDIKRLVESQKKDALTVIFNSDSKFQHARGIAELQKLKDSGIMISKVTKKEIKLDIDTLTKLADGTMDAKTAGLEQAEVDAALEEFAANARKRTVTIEKVTSRAAPTSRTMSETQGIQWWLWSMQEASRKQMERDGWDADSFAQLEEFLSPEAKALGRWMAKMYNEDAPALVDPVYRKLFNAPLPRHKNYSPIYRRNMNAGGEVMDLDSSDMNSGLAAGFTMSRVNTTASLVEMDALAAFLAHWENISHWVAHAELMRDMKAILLDKDTAVAIRQKKSEGYLQRLKQDISTIEKNGTNSANELVNMSRFWRWLMQYRAYKGLAFRISPIIKQTPALLNPLLADVPAHNYMMGMSRAFIEPQAFANEVSAMWKSDIIRRRIESGFSAESRVAMQGSSMTGSQAILAMQAGMMPMGMVDGGWTALGAAISFDYYRRGYMRENPQMTPEIADSKAIARVEKMIATSAQPSDVYARALYERNGNAFMRSMSMFVSDQRKALAVELMAIRKLATGKSKNKALDVQRAFVAHIVQAAVSQVMAGVIASLLGDDEDRDREWSTDQWTLALTLGPVNGLFVAGRLIDKGLRSILGLRVFPSDNLADKAFVDIWRAGKNMDDIFSDDPEDVINEIDNLSAAAGAGLSAAFGPAAGAVDVSANVLREARKIQDRLSE